MGAEVVVVVDVAAVAAETVVVIGVTGVDAGVDAEVVVVVDVRGVWPVGSWLQRGPSLPSWVRLPISGEGFEVADSA